MSDHTQTLTLLLATMFSTVARSLSLLFILFATHASSRETVKDAGKFLSDQTSHDNVKSLCHLAIIARGLVDSPLSIGTMATVFPSDHKYSPGMPC